MYLDLATTSAPARKQSLTSNQELGRTNFCSFVSSKVKQIFTWCCFRKVAAHSSNELETPLLTSREAVVIPSSRWLLGTATFSAAGLISSTALLAPIVTEIANRCFNEEMHSQKAFNECDAPYKAQVLAYTSLMSLSSFLMGYVLQRLCEKDRSERIHEASSSFSTKIKEKIALIQNKYRYEILLGLIGLYNGLPVIVSDPASLRDFLNCGFAGIGLGSALVGVYARQQQINFQEKSWLRDQTQSLTQQDLCKIGGFSLSTATILVLTSIPGVFPNNQSTEVIRALSLMLLCRPLGYATASLVDRKSLQNSFKDKAIFVISAALTLRSPFVLAGYCVYLAPGTLSSHLLGMSVLGFTQGVNDYRYMPSQEANIVAQRPRELNKLWYLIKNYWPTAGVIIFSSLLEKFRFLDCEGAASPLNDTCPIGFEISGYFFLGQVLVESRGVNLAIITGLTQYYARRLFRMIQSQTGCVGKIARAYLNLTTRAQFDLLSLFPYTIIQSRDEAYEDFYTYTPILPLVILGVTFGTYKDNVDTRYNS